MLINKKNIVLCLLVVTLFTLVKGSYILHQYKSGIVASAVSLGRLMSSSER